MTISIRKAALGALLPVLLGFAPLAAHAATTTFTFTGQNPTGVDPLGGVYQVGAFGGGLTNFEEVAGLQPDPTNDVLFTPANGLANATSFTLTITGGNDKLISLSEGFGMFFTTDHPNDDFLSDWNATENKAGTSITFTAPDAADALVAGERFGVDVTFTKDLPKNFAYTITWGGAAVPEPATWAMMIAGLGMIGGALRRKNAMGMAAA